MVDQQTHRANIGLVQLQKLKPVEIQNVGSHVHDDTFTDSVRYVYRVLNIALNRAVKCQILAANPCVAVEPPRQEKYKATAYNREELMALIRAAGGTQRLPRLIGHPTGAGAAHRRARSASGAGAQARRHPRAGRQPRRTARQGAAVGRRRAGRRSAGGATLGQERLQVPGRRLQEPGQRPAVGHRPIDAAAEDPRQLPGAAQHPVLRVRGWAARLRHRAEGRKPLLRRAGGQPPGQEHDRHALVPAQQDQPWPVAPPGL